MNAAPDDGNNVFGLGGGAVGDDDDDDYDYVAAFNDLMNDEEMINDYNEGMAERARAVAAANPDYPQLQSLDQWLERHGLLGPEAIDLDDETRVDRMEDRRRVAQGKAHEHGVWEAAFAKETQRETAAQTAKQQQLARWQGKTVTITCQNGDAKFENVDVVPLAEKCETLFALASWHHCNSLNDDDDDGTGDEDTGEKENSHAVLQLNLPDYHESAVRTFLDIVVHETESLQRIATITGSTGEEEENADDDEEEARNDLVVELTHLAHYLQHSELLEEAVQILLSKIDTSNCWDMTQLADQLHLPKLFEAALSHMMQSVHNLEDGECWDALSPELRNRIGAIQKAIQSSIHDQRSALYFGSIQEYLAIFAERVYYYKERLAEAMEQQADHQESASWRYAQGKIERQRVRLHTLQTAFQEQKKLFGTKQQNASFSRNKK